MALRYIFSHRAPRIYEGELIIGNMTSKRIAANYYIEGGSINILEDIARLGRRTIPLKLTGRETLGLLRIGLRNSFRSVGAKALLRPSRLSYFLDFFRAKRHYITEEAGVAHQVGDYRMVVQEGLRRPYEEATRRLDEGTLADGSALNADQTGFLPFRGHHHRGNPGNGREPCRRGGENGLPAGSAGAEKGRAPGVGPGLPPGPL